MSELRDPDLYRRTRALLEPGEIELDGLVVHTDLPGERDVEMLETTLAVGDRVAEFAGHGPRDVYVYSGNDDPEFASNQHQGLTVDGDDFVWECQQLLRGGTYDLVFYFERLSALEDLADSVESAVDNPATPVPGPEE